MTTSKNVADEGRKDLEKKLNEKMEEWKRENEARNRESEIQKQEVDASRKRNEASVRELEERLSRERGERERLERELVTNEMSIEEERRKLTEMEAILSKRREEGVQKTGEQIDKLKQEWAAEKSNLLAKKELEIKDLIEQLEKRFEDDYSKFIKTHKDAMQNALSQKNTEHEREKEKLMEIYQEKFGQYESEHQTLLKQIKVSNSSMHWCLSI